MEVTLRLRPVYIHTCKAHTHTHTENREPTCHNPPLHSPILETLLLYTLYLTLEWGDVVGVWYANCLIYPPILYNLLLNVYTLSIFLTLSLI